MASIALMNLGKIDKACKRIESAWNLVKQESLKIYVKIILTVGSSNSKEVTSQNPGVVTNQKIKPVEVILTAEKTLEGRNLQDGEFTFVLEGTGENDVIFHEKETNDKNGNVTLQKIIFDKIGKYNFTIHEEKGSDSSIIYDNTIYDVEFDVSLNESKDAYVLTTIIDGEDVENDSTPSPVKFKNIKKNPVQVELKATKSMDGKVPQDGRFSFELRKEDGTVIETVKNDAEGKISFSNLVFDEIGFTTFMINEVNDGDDSVIYDKLIYTVYVVTEAIHNNIEYHLYVTVAQDKEVVAIGDGTHLNLNSINFNNSSRGDAKVELSAEKTVNEKEPKGDEIYTFVLKDNNGLPVQTVNNNGSKIIFDALTFNKSGTYNYSISEIAGTEENVHYDNSIYDVQITITAPDYDSDFDAVTAIYKNGEKYVGVPLFKNLRVETTPTSESTQPTTESNEPTGESTQPTTESNEPTSESTQPTTESNEPTGESTQPTTESNEPTQIATETGEPNIEPTDKTIETVKKSTEKTSVDSTEDNHGKTPTTDVPKTGDNSGLHLWIALLFVSSGGILGISIFDKKKHIK